MTEPQAPRDLGFDYYIYIYTQISPKKNTTIQNVSGLMFSEKNVNSGPKPSSKIKHVM